MSLIRIVSTSQLVALLSREFHSLGYSQMTISGSSMPKFHSVKQRRRLFKNICCTPSCYKPEGCRTPTICWLQNQRKRHNQCKRKSNLLRKKFQTFVTYYYHYYFLCEVYIRPGTKGYFPPGHALPYLMIYRLHTYIYTQ